MILFYSLFVIVLLVVYVFAAVEFNSIANQKGYPGSKYGWWCFWFPVVGYLMVIALPDRAANTAAPVKSEFDNDALPEL